MFCKEELDKLNNFKKMCDKAGNYALLESYSDLNKKSFRTTLEQEALACVRAEILSRMSRK
jgi:hypothetical protein